MNKRFFDIVISLSLLIILSPVFLLVYMLVAIKLGRPGIFSQTRPGKDSAPFKMYKFRSMLNTTDEHGNLLPNELRHTKFGRALRSTSLDELPGLWNVLKGEMSLVGPRPLLVEYLPLYNDRQKLRHKVRPGITGWAQVNGRNAISWEQKFELDVWYVENHSLLLDLKILFLTVKKVVCRNDINKDNNTTMEKFTGTKQ